MPSDYVSDLEAQLRKVDTEMDRAARAVDHMTIDEKTHALSQMAHLRQQHENLVKRIAEAKAKGAENWSALHMSFQEEADALVDTLEKWLTRDE